MAMRKLTYFAGGLPGLLLSLARPPSSCGGWRVISEALTMGTLVAFMAYQVRLLGRSIADGVYAIGNGARVAQRVHEILDAPMK